MGAKFTPAPEVEEIANELIPLYHKHLQDYGVRVDYLFSDQKPESGGRVTLADARKIGGLNAYLSKKETDEDSIPLTFVCEMCVKWQIEINRVQIDANGDTYDVCTTCTERYEGLDSGRPSNKLIAKLEKGRQDAEVATAAGPPGPEAYFLICVYETRWEVLTRDQKVALVDHELCHCRCEVGDKGVKLWLAGHDLEEFTCIVDRHGLWKGDVLRFIEAGLKHKPQLRLWEDDSLRTEKVANG